MINNQVKIKPPEEAYYINSKAGNITENYQNMGIQKDQSAGNEGMKSRAQQEDEAKLDEDEDIATLLDIKRWMYKGNYTAKFLSTCPQPITIDSRGDRPYEEGTYVPSHGLLRQTKKHISEQSKAYLNRIDTYQIDEVTKEILVVDDYGITIMYDASLEDMVSLEKELAQISTLYIKKNELDFNFEQYEYALVDRVEVLSDLLGLETDYQFLKSQIILAYMDALEHSCDIICQQRLMQIIVDIMAWRPRLDLQRSWYFRQSYDAEIKYLKTMLELIKTASYFQMNNEKDENKL